MLRLCAEYKLPPPAIQRYNPAHMFRRAQQFFLRFVLLVMLSSFLSPSFGLGMVASHDQLAHASVGQGHADHEHDQPGPKHDAQDHQDAHSSIGHLLTHMPIGMFEMPHLAFPPLDQALLPIPESLVLSFESTPPFRPPRAFLPL